ncbi:heavy metal transporter [Humibacillus sp. DSM 29435]|uniref:heavy-metal-associated domain-containing protein n=1 Tax=Humibacillus sp. DSM 29435 TaxID=1869167 RepID=UPI00087324A9|nr:heavy metal-associated domain-containing protein [Humibacillus sp. DSM 29435]OFE17934.1 heavy metal transporter [Humibacillus sp. DSM 29435]
MNTRTVTTEVTVSGMTCTHCSNAVSEALTALPGVDGVSVDLVPDADSLVTITGSEPLDLAAVEAAVAEAGYSLR